MGDNGIIQQHLHPENHISICLLCISTCVSVVAKTVWLYLTHKLTLQKEFYQDFFGSVNLVYWKTNQGLVRPGLKMDWVLAKRKNEFPGN